MPNTTEVSRLPSGTSTVRSRDVGPVFSQLISRLFHTNDGCAIVLFTAVHHGAGLTTTVEQIAGELTQSGRIVIILDRALNPVNVASVSAFTATAGAAPGAAQRRWTRPAVIDPGCLDDLRNRCDVILVDGGQLYESAEIFRILPKTDGVVLIVEANRTTVDQIARAKRWLHEAGGAIIGLVLTKRRYPIPRWIYRWL